MLLPASALRVRSVARRCSQLANSPPTLPRSRHQWLGASHVFACCLVYWAAVLTPYRCCRWPDAARNQHTCQPAPRRPARQGGGVTANQAGAVAAC